MFRRIFLSFICILLLALPLHVTAEPPASSVAERLATLDIISQLDDRFHSATFGYMNSLLFVQGCLPCSVYNAVVALMGTPETDATTLLPELLDSLTDPKNPRQSIARIEQLPYALTKESNLAASALSAGVDVRSWSTLCNIEDTLQEVQNRSSSQLLVDKLTVHESWKQLVELALRLDAMGLGHAQLAFSSVSAGYGSHYNAPFGSGDDGHYISLYFQVDEFCRTGTFYLLDSVPRALLGEPVGGNSPYQGRYTFTLYKYTVFSQNFTPVRITPCIVQFNLREEQHAHLEELLTNPSLTDEERFAQLLQLHTQHMNAVSVFGMNQGLLYIPD